MITHGGRLPAETSRFFGRSHEAAAIREALAQSRLVTLTGPGGVGKTRLALRVADELTGAFADGVHLVQLSAVRDADGLLTAVAAALGLPAAPGMIAQGLSGSRVLLILDTCEHLVDTCAALADAILSGADGPVMLATSRQPLDLPGEVVFRIPPLGLTRDGSDGGDGGDGGAPGDAVALFADRAAAALPGFALTEDTRPKVSWLCRALDGIPLAIELAALRLRAVGLDELLVRLPGRVRLLAGGRRADDRQQTIQASITWSYDLCTPAERLLWNRLSVFSGGFGLAAAEAVCGGGELAPGDVLESLIGLVDKSVVLRDDFAGGDTRYRLLEVVREQGAAQADPADAAECAARHRDYYLQVARNFAASFVGPDQLRLVYRLEQDAANLRLALEWCAAAGQHDPAQLALGAELAVACLPWWACTGQLAQASRWLSRFLPENPAHHLERSRGSTLSPSTLPASAAPDVSQTPDLLRRLAGWLLAAPGGESAPSLLADLVAALVEAFEALTQGDFDECAARCNAVMAALPEGERWVRGWAGELSAPPARHQGELRQPDLRQPDLRQPELGRPEPGQPALAAAAGHAGRWQQLTAREREVAVLVAQGMTNKDIAARLVVSKRTVDAHIEHILAKLAYGSRVQIAALVTYEQTVEEEPAGGRESVCRLPAPRRPQEHASAPSGASGTSGAAASHTRQPSG